MTKIYPCIIGLGYVGLPLFIRLKKKFCTIGFDTDNNRIKYLKKKIDKNGEYNKDNYYWKSHSILGSINKSKDPYKDKLLEKAHKIRDQYENLSELYQSSKISNNIPLN